MTNLIFNYLLESSLCLALFLAAYRVFIASATYFSWMRFFLLVSTVLSLILPLIVIPVEWSSKIIPTDFFPGTILMQIKQITPSVVNNTPDLIQASEGITILEMILFGAFIVYVLGAMYKSYLLVKNLKKMHDLVKKSPKVKEEHIWIVCLKGDMPAFSFFNYVFINKTYKNLSSEELNVIKKHEMVHVKHFHTLDVLFVELVGIVWWFNPLINYLKKSLKEVHEYTVDEIIAGHGENKKIYAQLLLSLASDAKMFELGASFAGHHIKRRIFMIAKPRSSSKYKLIFAILIPLTASMLLSFSSLKDPKENSKTKNDATGNQLNLTKYCGVYFPSKKDSLFLKPVEIILKDNKLFITSVGIVAELHFEADSIFTYADNSARSIAFSMDIQKNIRGCALLKFVTKEQRHYLVLEGEYLKHKSGN